MKRWVLRSAVLAGLLALGIWAWQAWFPSPEKVIRRRLGELAQLASFTPSEGPLAKVLNPQKLANCFTPDATVKIEGLGYSRTFNGREQLRDAAMAARTLLPSLKVEFPDISVAVGADARSAVVNLTLRGRIPSERDSLLYELKVIFEKTGDDWVIRQVETVRTLM
jgi:hypothetical protein